MIQAPRWPSKTLKLEKVRLKLIFSLVFATFRKRNENFGTIESYFSAIDFFVSLPFRFYSSVYSGPVTGWKD